MQLCNLDMLVRRTLLERNIPIHYYLEVLVHSSSAIRELSKRSLHIINTLNLPVNNYGAVDLPGDFVDDVAVCFDGGGVLKQIPHRSSINPIRVHDGSTGAFVPQPNNSDNITGANGFFWGSAGWVWYWNVNSYGEPTGRFFGAKGGTSQGYEVIRKRRQIQLTGGFDSGSIILQYISNGQSVDNATQLDWLAFKAIQAYVDWMRSPNAAIKDSPEARTFYNEERLFRATKDELTVVDIVNIIRNSYTAAIKN